MSTHKPKSATTDASGATTGAPDAISGATAPETVAAAPDAPVAVSLGTTFSVSAPNEAGQLESHSFATLPELIAHAATGQAVKVDADLLRYIVACFTPPALSLSPVEWSAMLDQHRLEFNAVIAEAYSDLVASGQLPAMAGGIPPIEPGQFLVYYTTGAGTVDYIIFDTIDDAIGALKVTRRDFFHPPEDQL